jgi:hypothetical protein
MNTDHDDPRDEEYGYESPTAEEVAQMQAASVSEALTVDELILGVCSNNWRKVAMVIGTIMSSFDAQFPHLPFAYIQVRIIDLVKRGVIESQGNVMRMRHSEIRFVSGAKKTSDFKLSILMRTILTHSWKTPSIYIGVCVLLSVLGWIPMFVIPSIWHGGTLAGDVFAFVGVVIGGYCTLEVVRSRRTLWAKTLWSIWLMPYAAAIIFGLIEATPLLTRLLPN